MTDREFAPYRELAVAVIYRAWLDVQGVDQRAPRSARRFFKNGNSTLRFWCRVAGLDEVRIRRAFTALPRLHPTGT